VTEGEDIANVAYLDWFRGLCVTVLLAGATHAFAAPPERSSSTIGEPLPTESQAAPVTSTTPPKSPRWQLALHAGWWDAGADVTVPAGLFVGIGVPWVAPFLFDYTGRRSQWGLDSRIGYGYQYSEHLTVYGELLSAWVYDSGDPCGTGCISRTHRLFFFPAIGLRHRWASGFMIGADLTLAVLSWHHVDDSAGSYWFRKNISPMAGPAFSQVYFGYDWML